MALRTILQDPDERLRKKSREVKEITPRILELLDDMKETLKIAKGYGLAAPQVGVLRKVVVIDMGEEWGFEEPIELINPVITLAEGTQTGEEGCLSCGTRRGVVTRPMHVICEAYDREGNLMEYDTEGLFARCIAHECGHLEGQLYIDLMEAELKDNEYYDEEKGEIAIFDPEELAQMQAEEEEAAENE